MIMMQNETLIQVPKSQAKANKRQLEMRWDHEGSKQKALHAIPKPSTLFRKMLITHHKPNRGTWFLNLPLDECIDNTKSTKKWFEKQNSFEEQKCVDHTKSNNNTKILSLL